MSDLWARFLADIDNKGAGFEYMLPREPERWRALLRALGKGTILEVAVRKHSPVRNVPQFKILNATARQIAESSGHTIEEVKAQALVSCFGDEKLRSLTVLGRTIYLPMSTNELSKDEASKVIEWLTRTAEFLDLKLMDPTTYEVL